MAFMFVVGACYVISVRKCEDKHHKILSGFPVNLDDHDNSKEFVVHVYGYRKDSSEANFITGTTVSIPDIEVGST